MCSNEKGGNCVQRERERDMFGSRRKCASDCKKKRPKCTGNMQNKILARANAAWTRVQKRIQKSERWGNGLGKTFAWPSAAASFYLRRHVLSVHRAAPLPQRGTLYLDSVTSTTSTSHPAPPFLPPHNHHNESLSPHASTSFAHGPNSLLSTTPASLLDQEGLSRTRCLSFDPR